MRLIDLEADVVRMASEFFNNFGTNVPSRLFARMSSVDGSRGARGDLTFLTIGVWCSLLSGLLMQSFMLTAGLDGIRELGPTLLCGQ